MEKEMFTKLKNIAAFIVVMGALASCAAQQSAPAMKMDHSMCKKMMEQGMCCCCKGMSAAGKMSGGKQMQCMPQEEKEAEALLSPAIEEHSAHHPDKTQ